jgi:hypothetical protein
MMTTTSSKLTLATRLTLIAGLFCVFGVVSTARAGKPAAPVDIEYVQKDQYSAGERVEIELTLTPSTAVDHAEVQFRGSDGLMLHSGQQIALGSAAAGSRITHRIMLSAAADGRYYLSAVVRTSTVGRSLARVVAVPVIIGDASRLAKRSVGTLTALDATGERIKSLSAQ